MDTQTLLNLPRYHRKTFIALLVAIVVIIILLDSKLSEQPLIEALIGYLRGIAASILTALFVLWVVASFVPFRRSMDMLEELSPRQITSEFEKQLAVAKRWRYKGNFGRYMRGKVLPSLAGRQNFHISVCLLDPTDNELCEKHAKYRGSINSIDKGRHYDAATVALEVAATIVICAWYQANRNVAIEIHLSKVFDPLRIDSSDDSMILTVEDRRSPALKLGKDHFMYEHFELQMELARSQARKITLGGVREQIALAELSQEDVSAALRIADMDVLRERLGTDLILKTCRKSKNPYEN